MILSTKVGFFLREVNFVFGLFILTTSQSHRDCSPAVIIADSYMISAIY